MKRNIVLWAQGLLLGAFFTGCYTYTPPPAVLEGETFTQRQTGEGDLILKRASGKLTLDKAIEIAIANNPDYISAYHSVNAAKMSYYQAWGAWSPTISTSFGMQQTHNNYYHQVNTSSSRNSNFTTSTGIQASWLVFDGLARDMAILAAEHGYNYQGQMREDIRRRLILSVAYAYNDILLANEKRRIAVADKEFEIQQLEETRIKLNAGTAALSDLLNFQIKVNDAISNEAIAEYEYRVAVYTLAQLLGYPEGVFPEDVTFQEFDDTIDDMLTSVDVYLDTALHNRPDLAAYREQLEVTRYNMYQTYSAFSPQVSIDAAFGFNTSYGRIYGNSGLNNYHHTYQNSPSFSYGLNANWTIFNGLQRYNAMRSAQAQVAAAEFTVASSWLAVVNEVRTAYEYYVQNVKLAKNYKKDLSLVIKQRDLVEEQYRVGTCNITRLNEAQLSLVDAETALVSALINLRNAKAQLDAVTNSNLIGYTNEIAGEEKQLVDIDATRQKLNAENLSVDVPEITRDLSEVEKDLIIPQ